MKTLEWTTVDKSTWYDGPWKNEPDKKQWQDPETGYACLIHRGPMGALCGYVGITSSHPAYGKGYDEIIDISCHGGLTFSDLCMVDSSPEYGICHLVEPGEDDKVWWLGFDCAHSGDIMPKYEADAMSALTDFNFRMYGEFSIYRDIKFVENEIRNLAKQLKSMESI